LNLEEAQRLYMHNGHVYTVGKEPIEPPRPVAKTKSWVEEILAFLR